MKKRLLIYLTVLIISITMGTSGVFAAAQFDTKDVNKGVIHITYDGGGKTKVIIQKGDKKYTYDINSSGQTETYPLQLGNGTYKISLFANTSGNSYRLITSKNVNVKLTNPNDVFLTSIQNINWNVDSKAVEKAVELTKDIDDLEEKAKVLWDFVIHNHSYDYGKLAKLQSGYIPVIDMTLEEKKGICYDFSSLYAAMLRSQGKPAKLIKGYAPEDPSGYHAWNEVYDESKKEWVVIDTTYDLQIVSRYPTITMLKNHKDFNKVYEY